MICYFAQEKIERRRHNIESKKTVQEAIMESRPFGKIGESFPILSFGGQRVVDEHNCTEEEAIEIVNTAIDRGIR